MGRRYTFFVLGRCATSFLGVNLCVLGIATKWHSRLHSYDVNTEHGILHKNVTFHRFAHATRVFQSFM